MIYQKVCFGKYFVSENVLKSVGNYIAKFVKLDPNNFEGN